MKTNHKSIKTVIVEHDKTALELIKNALSKFKNIEIVLEITNSDQAHEFLAEKEVVNLVIANVSFEDTLLFSSFSKQSRSIPIILISDNVDSLSKVFDYNIVGYILKPINELKFEESLKRVFDVHITEYPTKNIQEDRLSYDNMILMNVKNMLRFVRISQIILLQANGNYVRIHLADGNIVTVHGLLKIWENKLPEDHFIRIHRSTIVNINNIIKIEKGNYDTGTLHLLGFTSVFEVSRNYFSLIKHKYKLTSNLF
jgi:two-component system LytT family response regulator